MITQLDKNTALVLIDLQKGILDVERIHPVEDILRQCSVLLDAFHAASLPAVIVHVNPAGASWLKSRKQIQTVSTAFGADFTQISDKLPTKPDDIFITKRTWNAFYDTSLHDELKKRMVTGIVLGGISTSIGVEGTARAASELGYNISFATDAMTDSVEESHRNSITNIFPRLGELGTTRQIVEKLNLRGFNS